MAQRLCLLLGFAISSAPLQADNVSLGSDQVGSSFRFVNMEESGDSVPPSQLQTPTLVTVPRDTIKFSPSAFVAVTNGASSTVTQNLSTQLTLTLQALNPSLGLDELQVSVAGTWDEAVFGMPGASATAALTLQLDLISGGITKNLNITVDKNPNKTWAGSLTVNRQYLIDNFFAPSSGLADLFIRTTQTVSATAAFGSASSAITYLDVSASAVPEPSSAGLLLVGVAVLGLNRRRQKTKN